MKALNTFTKPIKLAITIAIAIFTLASCQSREEKVISKLDSLSERIEKDGSNFDADDWEEAIKDYTKIHEEMQDCEFTKEQLHELGKKEGKVSIILAKECSKALGKDFMNYIGSFGAFAKGFKEGVEDNVSEKDFNEVGNGIYDALQEFADQLKD